MEPPYKGLRTGLYNSWRCLLSKMGRNYEIGGGINGRGWGAMIFSQPNSHKTQGYLPESRFS